MMMMILLLIYIPLTVSLPHDLQKLKIMSVSGYGSLPTDMQSELQRALKWFEDLILVKKHPKQKPVEIQDVIRTIPEYRRFSSVFVQTPSQRANFQFKSENFKKLLGFADFTLFVVSMNAERCKNDPGLLAEAMPISLVPDTRPALAIMSICPRENHPISFYDLFRHEILHGLGYGMIIDKKSQTVKKSEKFEWKTPKSSQILDRHFLDFDEFGLKWAKNHFDCQTMRGLEADGERKNHLNEYIFGNELMTTDLEIGGNIFSWISAGVLERTFNGNEQWYHINRTFIEPEASLYNYGKHFGCEFLEKSCYEFIVHTEKVNSKKVIAPFCSINHKNLCYGPPDSPSKTLKIINEQQCEVIRNPRHFLLQNNRKLISGSSRSDNTFSVQPTLGFSSENAQRRFCPVMKIAQSLPSNYQLAPCPS